MTLSRGTVTLRRFACEGGPPSLSAPELVELLERDRFRGRLFDAMEGERSGWVTHRNLLQTDFTTEHCYLAPYLLFALRTDRKAVPPALLRAMVDQRAERVCEESGLARLSASARTELRDEIERELLPRILPSVTAVEVCWNLVTGEVWIMASADRAVDRVRRHFAATFSSALRALDPGSLALRDPAAIHRLDRMAALGTTTLTGPEGGAPVGEGTGP